MGMNIEYGMEICFAKDYNFSTKNQFLLICSQPKRQCFQRQYLGWQQHAFYCSESLVCFVFRNAWHCFDQRSRGAVSPWSWSVARRTIAYHGTLTGSPSDFRKPDYTAPCLHGQRISPWLWVYHRVPSCTSVYHYVSACTIMYHYVAEWYIK